MKRINKIAIALVLLLFLFTSCSTKQEAHTVLTKVSPAHAGGMMVIPAREIDPAAELPATFTVYENKYPVTHGGPQYEFDAEAEKELEQAMNSFLELLYQEAELSVPEGGFSLSAPKEGEELAYNNRRALETENFSVYGWLGTLSTHVSLSPSDPLIASFERGDTDLLLENFAVRAAMRYVGTKEETMDLQKQMMGKESFQYQITEASDSIADTIYRDQFRSVRIELLHTDDWAVLIVDAYRQEPKKLMEVEAFSPEQVIDFARQSHPELDFDSAVCRLYYDSLIEPGKYRPCYEIEITDGYAAYFAPVLAEELPNPSAESAES